MSEIREETDAHLRDLRLMGWRVAVHNDFRQAGRTHTFYLLTHPCGVWMKGEGAVDHDGRGAVHNGHESEVLRGLRDKAEAHRCLVERRCTRCGAAGVISEDLTERGVRCGCGGYYDVEPPLVFAESRETIRVEGRWPGRVTLRHPTEDQLRRWRANYPPKASVIDETYEAVRVTAEGEPPAERRAERLRWRYEVVNLLMHEASKDVAE